MRLSLLFLAAAAAVTSATKVILPLYEWSEDCWPELQQAAVQNPSLDFILIFNPNSGPITDASDPSLYCVPRLRKLLPRSTFVGYVPTGYGERSAAAVKADVATYKKWNTIKVDKAGSTARLDGIFFDEAAWEPTSTNLVLYSSYANAVRAAYGAKGKSTVVFNPGTVVSANFYKYADIVVSFETYANQWKGAASLPSSALVPKSAIMLHTYTGDQTTALATTVRQIVPRAAAVFITDVSLDKEDVYKRFGGNWLAFCKYVAHYSA
ncbi:Spherulation-specific family 4 [Rhodotorula diobovata]|uniref:Spherulation-specific family 4 n=1 Tax=Rhodotorula diobovata TaxID=5288 RepID=A0A5C5FN57_9BASI|nr:Spherulation-specific family 4 [Rhodotorula diobovata]